MAIYSERAIKQICRRAPKFSASKIGQVFGGKMAEFHGHTYSLIDPKLNWWGGGGGAG